MKYNYNTEQEIITHLGNDLIRMKYSIIQNGYVCQEQYEKLDAYLCEDYAHNIVNILKEETDRDIWYAYSSSSFFVFFDKERIKEEYAKERANEFRDYLYN